MLRLVYACSPRSKISFRERYGGRKTGGDARPRLSTNVRHGVTLLPQEGSAQRRCPCLRTRPVRQPAASHLTPSPLQILLAAQGRLPSTRRPPCRTSWSPRDASHYPPLPSIPSGWSNPHWGPEKGGPWPLSRSLLPFRLLFLGRLPDDPHSHQCSRHSPLLYPGPHFLVRRSGRQVNWITVVPILADRAAGPTAILRSVSRPPVHSHFASSWSCLQLPSRWAPSRSGCTWFSGPFPLQFPDIVAIALAGC